MPHRRLVVLAFVAAFLVPALFFSCPFYEEEPYEPSVGLEDLELLSDTYSLEIVFTGLHGIVKAYEPDEYAALLSGDRIRIECRYTLAEIRYTVGDGNQAPPTETTGTAAESSPSSAPSPSRRDRSKRASPPPRRRRPPSASFRSHRRYRPPAGRSATARRICRLAVLPRPVRSLLRALARRSRPGAKRGLLLLCDDRGKRRLRG